ncbi:MAG: hypothetical protein MI717_02690 [Spirochaetales bacterium]|nr:hypothetical protein [Spirochaetales bacterium]
MTDKSSSWLNTGVLIITALVLSSCVSPSQLLNRAEEEWEKREYALAIEDALASFDLAWEQDQEGEDVLAAKDFLLRRHPLAERRLDDAAQALMKGNDTEREEAWILYQMLYDMNEKVFRSPASAFLQPQDFSEPLRRAKAASALIKYDRAISLMNEGTRESYIQAADLFDTIDAIIPDYRDGRRLKRLCREKGTITISFASDSLDIRTSPGIPLPIGVEDGLKRDIRNAIEDADRADFLAFVEHPSEALARKAGADVYISIDGRIDVTSGMEDDYTFRGQVTWRRMYEGSVTLRAQCLTDGSDEAVGTRVDLDQQVTVEFLPAKSGSEELGEEAFIERFSNASWYRRQLENAQQDLEEVVGHAFFSVWALANSRGDVAFLDRAMVSKNSETEARSIAPEVYRDMEDYIQRDLPRFLEFADMNLANRLREELRTSLVDDSAFPPMLKELGEARKAIQN